MLTLRSVFQPRVPLRARYARLRAAWLTRHLIEDCTSALHGLRPCDAGQCTYRGECSHIARLGDARKWTAWR